MIRGPEDYAVGATAGFVMFATTAALMLIIYAILTFVSLLSAAPAQELLGTVY